MAPNYPTYVKSLRLERAQALAELNALRDGIGELAAYLTSAKFQTDQTVQTADVLRRLLEVNVSALRAASEVTA